MSKARCFITLSLLLIQIACSRERISLRSIPTPFPADGFDFPLDPGHYGPYIQGITGPLNVDTRFGIQNPALGDTAKCFHDRNGQGVPFRKLYHAGEDWFRLDAAGQADTSAAAGEPVRAVAQGVVYLTQEIGDQGWIVVVAHRLADDTPIYSAYWHVSDLQVERGKGVDRGQVIAVVQDQGWNSHLHWELRSFADGSDLFPSDSAGGRGACNGYAAAVGYTWDDDVSHSRPDYWGYIDPRQFIESHRP